MAKKRKRASFFGRVADRFTSKIYSFFVNGRIGDMLSSHDTLCKRSLLARTLSRQRRGAENSLIKYPEALMERSISSRTLLFIRTFLATLSLNVYGAFFVFYGLISGIAYLIPAFTSGFVAFDIYPVITSGTILLMALPLLFSFKSAVTAFAGSRMLGRIIRNVLCIPEERLKATKQYGGTLCTFIAALLGIGGGVLAYFTHPLYLPIVFFCLAAVFLIFAFPETGIIITLAALPFMQYLPKTHIVLFIMMLITTVAYFCKVFQRKRRFDLSPEITMVMIFCGFIAVGGMFSRGGATAILDSIAAIVYILGGFVLTYNLVNTAKMLSACLKTICLSFILLCLTAIWEGAYNGFSERIIDSLNPTISTITEENMLYLLDDGVVFGMFALLVFPLLSAYVIKCKTFRGGAFYTVGGIILIAAAWMCSHYEIIIALVIELILFWFIFSHKTMTATIFALIPIGIIAILYPYAVEHWFVPDISSILMEYMPASLPDAELYTEVMRDSINMLLDGNLTGIGVGEHAFTMAFAPYASGASVGATQPMSLWLQIVCWSGIGGLVAFVVFLLFLMKRSFGFFISSDKKEQRGKALALYCGIITAVLLGFVYGIWVDVRILYLFWVCTGLLLGYVRLGDENEEIRRAEYMDSDSEKDVSVVFYD